MRKKGSRIARRIIMDMEREHRFREKYKELQHRQKNKQEKGAKNG